MKEASPKLNRPTSFRFVKDEYFANRRLYTSLPLFGGSGSNQAQGPNGQWVYVQEGAKPAAAAVPVAVAAASASGQEQSQDAAQENASV